MSETLQAKMKPNAKRSLQRKRAQRKEDEIKPKRKALRSAYLQKKMDVSTPGDPQEQEADRVADEVSRMPRSAARKQQAQRTSLAPEDNAEQPQSLQTKIQRQQDEAVQTKLMRAEDELQTKLQREADEEGDAVQPKLHRQVDGEEATAGAKLFRQSDEEAETAQSKLQRETDEESLQAKGAPELNDEAERKIEALRGQGMPLPEEVRQEMEEKMSADFSSVSIHTGGDAADLCKQINARAFTVGSDIFFAAGEYAPENEAGRKLLVHELTHVVQQQDLAVQPKLYRTEDGNSPPVNTETEYDGPEGTASTSNGGRITIKEIHFPNIAEKKAKTGSNNIVIRKGRVERDTNQLREWSRFTRDGSGLSTKLDEKTNAAWKSGSESNPTYFMKVGSRRSRSYLIGTRTNIRDRVIRPYWTPEGSMKTYDVDHKKEYQLGGHDEEGNLWLLDSRTNRSSGSRINSKINQALGALLRAWSSSRKPSTDTARDNYSVTLGQIHWDGPVEGDGANYSIEDISESAKQMDKVFPMNRRAVQRAGLDPGEGRFIVFNNSTGGRARTISLPSSPGDAIPFTDQNLITGFRPTTATFIGDDNNYIEISGMLWADNPAIKGHGFSTSFTITRMENLPQAGYLNVRRAEAKIRDVFSGEIEASALSPLQLTSVGMDDSGAPVVEGRVNTDISFLEGASIGFFIQGNDFGIEKTFASEELNMPDPFEIEEAALTVSLSTQRGLAAQGNVSFKIDGVGDGQVAASVGTSQTFDLAGEFNFDERIFGEGTNAQVTVGYQNDEWSMGGSITIPEGKVPGIRTATITVDYSEGDGFSAQGDAELDVPGVESGTLSITSSEEEGFSIGGSFNLSADTPGIRGGTISAEVRERPDGTGFALSASGEAQPDIPGINANLLVSYNDGAFTAEVTAQYARGMLSGEILAGVTNRTVGEDGQLSETAEPDSPLIVYGGGSLTLQIAPWLQGTAGVQFAPDGEITVTGEIGLPDQLEIFSRSEINKSIFNIAVQAPIVPGIVAEVGGGLSAQAGIGPGVIDELRLGITYNPAREEETRITGNAHLTIPADAGLRLAVRAGIGLGITGASATGGLEIGGTLGITGAAEAGVQVEWSPASGLAINADVSVSAQPSFTFDISGYVSVRALGFSVYDETYRFASFEFGSDYRFGISLPIHYREGEPFDISLDDVEFEVPNIDTNQLMRSLISRVT